MRHVHLLLGALVLGSCAAPQTAPPQAAPAPVVGTPAPAPSPTEPAPAPAHELTPLGTIQLAFSGLNDPDGFTAELVSQALTDIGGIQLEPLATSSFTVGTRGAGGMRYLSASFRVRNAAAGGAAYAVARQNLTLVAASTASTIGETAISGLQRFDGSAASPAIAQSILPTHTMTLDRTTDLVRPKLGGEDLQVFAEDEVSVAPAGTVRLFPYGFVVRKKGAINTRQLPASPATGQFDGVVTVAVKLPLQANAADDPFRFSMNFAVMDDSRTRVTESVEEQGASSDAAVRAGVLGANTPIMTLCGSSLNTATGQFIGSATTAGNTARLAKLGGNIALKKVALAYGVPGNTRLSVNTAAGLASAYSTYNGAALSFGSGSSRRGGSVTLDAGGDFTFVSKAGDGAPAVTDQLVYRVADNQGCSSTDTTADVNVSGRVWFVNNTGAAGDGRQTTPFNTLLAAQNASAAGDYLYVAQGNGTTSGQNSGLILKTGQTLIGAGAALTIGGVTYAAAGQPASIGNSGGVGLTVAQNNAVQGLSISGTSGGVSGTGFGTLTLTVPSVSASAGPALNLTTGTLTATLDTLNSNNSATSGALLTGVGGTLSVTGTGTAGSGGTIQGAANHGVSISPQNQTLTVTLDRLNIQNNRGNGLLARTTSNETGRALLTVRNSSFTSNAQAALSVEQAAASASRTVLIDNTVNNLTSDGSGFSVSTAHAAAQTDEFIAQNNTITLDPGRGSTIGIRGLVRGQGTLRASASGNTVTGFSAHGLAWYALASGARADVTMTGNRASTSSGNALEGALVQDGEATISTEVCLNASGNVLSGPPGLDFDGLYLWIPSGTPMQIQGLTGNARNYLQGQNPGTTVFVDGGAAAGTCAVPTP
ncbi:VcbS [Deinococcus sp. HMF7620]|uniref:VcbS n=1 Tax=Deinococcus arboris TaxID=2682977 RepID=A0A7C9HQR5_9DEIO|nr:VcbS [Deinococcus arboris]MVN86389.1 VcbS [Deinococcus arboris]